MNRRSVLEFSPGAAGPLLRSASGWRHSANCADTDPEIFFSEKPDDIAAAKLICQACPVTGLCLREALENGITHGVWGGMTHDERRKVPVEAPPRQGPQRCPKDRHLMTAANTGANGRRCLTCQRDNERRKRETERVLRTGSSSPQSGRRAA